MPVCPHPTPHIPRSPCCSTFRSCPPRPPPPWPTCRHVPAGPAPRRACRRRTQTCGEGAQRTTRRAGAQGQGRNRGAVTSNREANQYRWAGCPWQRVLLQRAQPSTPFRCPVSYTLRAPPQGVRQRQALHSFRSALLFTSFLALDVHTLLVFGKGFQLSSLYLALLGPEGPRRGASREALYLPKGGRRATIKELCITNIKRP